MKNCISCGVEKPLDRFYRHANMADGRLNKCQDCCKKQRREYELSRPKAALESRLKSYTKKPSKRAAERIVENAIRTGDIVKPERCGACGVTPGEGTHAKRLEAHHFDYNSPLDVTWLCTPCHRECDKRRGWREDGIYVLARSPEGQRRYRSARKEN